MMRRSLLIGSMLFALSACGKDEPKPTEQEAIGPQIATSIDDVAIPVDQSAQITAIDATTGDASGMPKDGGAVVKAPKPEARPAVEPGTDATVTSATPVPTAAPTVTPPPPAVTPPPPPSGQ